MEKIKCKINYCYILMNILLIFFSIDKAKNIYILIFQPRFRVFFKKIIDIIFLYTTLM